MVEVSPKVVLARVGLAPVPCLLDPQVGPVHIRNVPPVGELGKLSPRPKSSLAEIVAHCVAGDFEAADGVSDSDDTASPSLVEGLVGVGVRCEIGVVAIVGSGEDFGMDDAGDGQFLRAGSVSEQRVATVAGHPSDEAVLLGGPDGRPESEPSLVAYTLTIIREEL